ncbi:MAG: S1 RNA-binding domain-containing protein [Haliscomenobacter sp.]
MLEIGKYHILRVLRETRVGCYLGDREGNEVLLPSKYVPAGTKEGDSLSVFIYRDGEERLIATTQTPLVLLHHFARLQVKMITQIGAFLDWGLDKDLLVPFREQAERMVTGKSYLVYLYQDEETGRLTASAQIKKFLSLPPDTVSEGDEVEVMGWEASPLGMKVIVDQLYAGLIFESELFAPLLPGEIRKGYVLKVREEGKIDISLRKPGYASIEGEAAQLLEALQANAGFLPLTDHSDPEEIRSRLAMSKKSFKKAVGLLYKSRRIRLETDGIYLV